MVLFFKNQMAMKQILLNINENLYDNGWVLYGGADAAYIVDIEGYVKRNC